MTASTSSSGAEAPAVTPTTPERSSGSSAASLMRNTRAQPEADGQALEGPGVGGVGRADDHHGVAAGRDRLERRLAVRRGEAEVGPPRLPQRRGSAPGPRRARRTSRGATAWSGPAAPWARRCRAARPRPRVARPARWRRAPRPWCPPPPRGPRGRRRGCGSPGRRAPSPRGAPS